MSTDSDTASICLCSMANEDSEHFLMHCPAMKKHELNEEDLLGLSLNVPGLELGELNTQSLCHSILYGNPGLSLIASIMTMEPTINFIKATKRFEM